MTVRVGKRPGVLLDLLDRQKMTLTHQNLVRRRRGCRRLSRLEIPQSALFALSPSFGHLKLSLPLLVLAVLSRVLGSRRFEVLEPCGTNSVGVAVVRGSPAARALLDNGGSPVVLAERYASIWQ
jgi:hypothetical protein